MEGAAFQHEAFFYAGEYDFLDGTATFLRRGVEAGEPALAVLAPSKIDALRCALDGHADAVSFADMTEVGSNPARILSAWRTFADEHGGRAICGIGEPIWDGRGPAELVECQHHESLLNLAFAGRSDFRLLCPYDTAALPGEVLEEAEHSHPLVRRNGTCRESRSCRSLDEIAAPFARPLPEPCGQVESRVFQRATLSPLRHFVADRARDAGLDKVAVEDLVLAVSELATNSVLYGGGGGLLRIWQEGDTVVCEVADRGRIDEPLVGRELPQSTDGGGHGLWLANQMCDLVQIRSYGTGSAVRLHKRRT